MGAQQDNSRLKLEESGYLKISNPITKKKIFLTGGSYVEQAEMSSDKGIIYTKGNYITTLDKATPVQVDIIEKVASALLTFDGRNVDEAFLEHAENELKDKALTKNGVGIIGRFKTHRYAKKIDKFAQNIGFDTNIKQDAEEYIKQAQEQKNIEKRSKLAQKALESRNSNTVKMILNG